MINSKELHRIVNHNFFHTTWSNNFLNNPDDLDNLSTKEDIERLSIGLNSKNIPNIDNIVNCKYLYGILSFNEFEYYDKTKEINKVINIITINPPINLYSKNNKYDWSFTNGKIINSFNKMELSFNLDEYLTLEEKSDCEWTIINDVIQHKKTKKYIGCDIHYCLYLVKNINHAINWKFINNQIHFVKPKLKLNFDINNFKLNIDFNIFNDISKKIYTGKKNICILLAGGFGNRFGKLKQLEKLGDKTLIEKCLDIFFSKESKIDNVILVVNSKCDGMLLDKLLKNYKNLNIQINDINCRLKSIETAVNFINNNFNFKDINNLVIHDVARPFITVEDIINLINANDKYVYSQYCLEITGGLINLEGDVVDRDKIKELCTPFCVKYDVFEMIFKNYIKEENRITWEIIPILSILKIEYKLIFGNLLTLRKITYKNDL